MTMEKRYRCLLEEFLSVAEVYIDETILEILKEYYAQCINSNRRLSSIKDLRTLLTILEKRDILNTNSVKPLLYISCTFLNNPYIRDKLKEYEDHLDNAQYSSLCNMYQNINSGEEDRNSKAELSNVTGNCTLQKNIHSNKYQVTFEKCTTNDTTCYEQEETLKQMVLLKISERIGRSWKDTVRYLGIREHQIDMIQNKYPYDLKEQTYDALKLYVSQCNNNSWKLNLICALEKARRKDLKELVEELTLCTRIE